MVLVALVAAGVGHCLARAGRAATHPVSGFLLDCLFRARLAAGGGLPWLAALDLVRLR